jgi:putative transcriptional regulator
MLINYIFKFGLAIFIKRKFIEYKINELYFAMGSLENHILISMPHLQDPNFNKSIVLICEHSNDGALGLIINKAFEKAKLKMLFNNIDNEDDDILKISPKLFFGGPVFIERGILLHSNSYNSKDSIKISDQFSITSSNKILKDIHNSNSLKNYKLMLGHAGWTSGQLEKEIENGDWLMQSTSIDFVFNTNESKMWQIAAKSFGVELSEISGFGGSA